MRIPKIKGVIKRRLLVNFRASPEIVQPLLPAPFRPKLHKGFALVGICLIRLEQIRPAALPGFLGASSENAAHRIAVQWNDASGNLCEGVYIPRRDSSSWLNQLAGGRLFPGVHHAATFSVMDQISHIELSMQSRDGEVSINVVGSEANEIPKTSCFASLVEASAFFEAGSLGYSASHTPEKSDGLILHTSEWRVRALEVSSVHSSYFEDPVRFPQGSVCFDHALVMRNILHEWHWAEDMIHHKARQPLLHPEPAYG
ncbi:MAG: hypothetical protein K0R17_320 [Rariglobus sp.]|jgi:hypothetical protein|nr:hypothetical protein [Rariglobus sp.]